MRSLFSRLAREEYRALGELGRGKNAETRFAGLRRSDRNEAKWLLIGMAPAMPLMISDQMGFERDLAWNAWAIFAGMWFALMAGTMIFVACKSFIRSLGQGNG